MAAADRAAAGFANVVAAELYERALAAADLHPVDMRDRARVLEAVGDMRERFGAFEPALDAYSQARDALEQPLDRARVIARIAHCLDREGRYDEAVEAYAEARALVGDEAAEGAGLEMLARIEVGLASVAYRRAVYPDAIAHAKTRPTSPRGPASRSCSRMRSSWPAWPIPISDKPTPSLCSTARSRSARSTDCPHSRVRAQQSRHPPLHRGSLGQSGEYYPASREANFHAGDPLGAAVQENNVAEIFSTRGGSTRRSLAFATWCA